MKLKCPKCGSNLKTIENRGIEVDICESCNGVWFDLPEIEQLSDTIKEFNIVPPRLENLKIAEIEEEARTCPRCGSTMYKVTMSGRPPVFDYCPNDHGYWFDANELQEYIKGHMSYVKKPSVELFAEIVKS